MIRRLVLAATLLLVLAPALQAQTNVTIHGLVYNELKAPVSNATVLFIAPDTGQQITFQTNASGRFVADVPGGEYRLRAYMPNASGELWHERVVGFSQSTTYGQPLVLNRTEPFIPRLPAFSPSNNLNQTGNTTGRGIDVLVRIPLQYVGPGANKTVRAEADIRALNGAQISQALLGNTTLRAGRIGWLNATLPPAPSNAYHAREQSLHVTIRLYDDANGTLLDTFERVGLTVQDECTGATIAITIDLTAAPRRTLCAPADDESKWIAWAAQARHLQSLDAQWAARAKANASAWDADRALAFWHDYDGTTRAARTPVESLLDRAQTDNAGQPRWGDLQTLRQTIDANRSIVRAHVASTIQDHLAALESQEDVQRIRTGATLLALSLPFAALGAGGAWTIVRGWKQRTEYWIGYSANSQARNPLLWIALAATVCLVLGASLGFLMGGPDWVSALRGGP